MIRVGEGGVAARAAARQFVIGDATAIRWVKRWRESLLREIIMPSQDKQPLRN